MSQSLYLKPLEWRCLNRDLQDPHLPKTYKQRIQIILLTDEGKTQSEICQLLGCSAMTARRWMLMTKQGKAEQWNNQPIGRPQKVNQDYLLRLEELLKHRPKEFGSKSEYWKAKSLAKQLKREFGVEISDRHINRLLKQRGLTLAEFNANLQGESTL